MKDSNELILGDIIKLTRSSENKFKLGNFKGAIDDKMKANAILKSKSCNEKIVEKYREELSRLYSSKFDFLKSAPSHICDGLNLKKDTYWIMCLAEILDLHKQPKFGKTKSVEAVSYTHLTLPTSYAV